MPVLTSVNVGRPETIGVKAGLTGICKRPQDGSVEITPLGLAGDAVLDTRHHGGPEQAVYLYLQSDYDWWSHELAEPLAPGTFGENLTLEGVDNETLKVGDRFVIGTVVLEVTAHRAPCNTLARRMGDPRFVKRFQRAGRPGAYCRVLVPGQVRAGDAVEYQPYQGAPVPVSELMALEGVRDIDETTLRRALAAPVHAKMRADFEARLPATS